MEKNNLFLQVYDARKIKYKISQYGLDLMKTLPDLGINVVQQFDIFLNDLSTANYFQHLKITEVSDYRDILNNLMCILKNLIFNITEKDQPNSAYFELILTTSKIIASEDENFYQISENVTSLFHYILMSLKKHSVIFEKRLQNLDENESLILYYDILKFFAEALKFFILSNRSVDEDDVLMLVDSLPLIDGRTMKIFSNDILPSFSNLPDLKLAVLQMLWKKIRVYFIDSDESDAIGYTMLYCLCEQVFDGKSNDISFTVHNDSLFWEIIQRGLVSDLSPTRKKVRNILKLFLCNVGNIQESCSGIFYCKFREAFEDIITLLEVFEEKQVHVIKPVLPRFSKILLLTSKDEDPALHFSWVIVLCRRMLRHESKFLVKWCLNELLTRNYAVYPVHQQYSEDFLKMMLESMNNQSLFSRSSEQDNFKLFLSAEKIQAFLSSYIISLEGEKQKVQFFRYLISTVASISWSSVALLHCVLAMTSLKSYPSWNDEDLLHVRKIMSDSHRNQESTLNCALECSLFKCCTLFLDWEKLKLESVSELLMHLKYFSIVRGSPAWLDFLGKMREFDFQTTHKSSEYCSVSINKLLKDGSIGESTLEIKKITRLLILLADVSQMYSLKMNSLNWSVFVEPVVREISNAHQRPYMQAEKLITALRFFTILLGEISGPQQKKESENGMITAILELACDCVDCFEYMMFSSFDDVDLCCAVFDCIELLCQNPVMKQRFLNDVGSRMVEYLLSDDSSKMMFFFQWNLYNCLHEFDSSEKLVATNKFNMQLLSKILNEGLLNQCSNRPSGCGFTEKELWLKYSNRSLLSFWKSAVTTLKHLNEQTVEGKTSEIIPLLSQEAIHMFSSGPKSIVPQVAACLKFIIPYQDSIYVKDLLDSAFTACMELRGSDLFRPAVDCFIEAVFQPCILNHHRNILISYYNTLKNLSENGMGIYFSIIRTFCQSFPLEILEASDFVSIPIFVSALTYGPIHNKGCKIIEETLVYLNEMDFGLHQIETHKLTFLVRVTAVNYLLENNKKICYQEFAFRLMNALFDLNIQQENEKSSHFSNSLCHRVRNRAWQVILLLQPSIDDVKLQEKILDRVLVAVKCENQQPSLRYLQEWTLFNLSVVNRDLHVKVISLLSKCVNERANFLISVLSVIYLLLLRNKLSQDCAETCLAPIFALCMSQNFTLRLYAKMVLEKLSNLCEDKSEFISKVAEHQSLIVDRSNFSKNIEKLSSNFFFSAFDPEEHFTLETIFYDMPYLSNLPPDEAIKPVWFERFSELGQNIKENQVSSTCPFTVDSNSNEQKQALGTGNGNSQKNKIVQEVKNFDVRFRNVDDRLFCSSPTSWSSKSFKEETHSEGEFCLNFQKKITPIRDILCDDEDNHSSDNISKRPKGDLIVVASLIDRIPNLGGLCRTCEVFGAKELIVGSMRYVQDKQFQNLAVSAEKWVQMKEVKPHCLRDYLLSMKESGYTLLGAEQTEDSQSLNCYQFPQKCLLVLGHEKEGLPMNVIQLLDKCVEIPQWGMTRSLNVHVSGAILIWEYAKQHLFEN